MLASETGNIVNPTNVEQQGDAFGTDPTGAGVGPFELQRFAPGEEVLLSARDDYWGGPVCIETLRFVGSGGADLAYEAFSTGEHQVAFVASAQATTQALEDGVPNFSRVVGASIGLWPNVSRPDGATHPTTDVRVRQAIAYAIDHELINERAFSGLGRVSNTIFWHEEPVAPDVEGTTHDRDRAAALVAEVIAEGEWDGSLLYVHTTLTEQNEMAIVVEALLEDIGIDVEREPIPATDVGRRVAVEASYELAHWGMGITEEAPWFKLNQFLSTSTRSRNGFADPAMDSALDVLRVAVTREEKQAALVEVQRLWNELVPAIAVYHELWMAAYDPSIHGIVHSRDLTLMFHDAYVEE
jgi:peptide/nickel transport system substrate-binding protein